MNCNLRRDLLASNFMAAIDCVTAGGECGSPI
jgi:hypothetical protein